jgi:hypothetical protein
MVRNMAALQSLTYIVVKDEPLVLWEIGLLQKLRKLKVLLRNLKVNWKAFVGSLGKLACSLHTLYSHYR